MLLSIMMKAQNWELDLSDFYWEGLGIPDYKKTLFDVSKRFEDFTGFLARAIKGLNRFSYSYEFNCYTKLELDTKDFKDLPEHLTLYSDEEFSSIIFDGEFKHGQRRITIIGYQNISHLFVKGIKKQIKILSSKFILREIKPVNVIEEEENLALDTLFESGEVYHGKRSRDNSLKILHKDREKLELEIDEPETNIKTGERLMVEYNTYNLKVQKQAMEDLFKKPQKHMRPLLNLMLAREFVNWEDFESESFQEYTILKDASSPGTDEQREFTNIALGTTDFAILEGPPGSGKTSTLLEIILNLCSSGKKVLMVASTHVAVDNILERLSEVKNGSWNLMSKFGVIPLRIGDEGSVSEKVSGFTVNNRINTENKRLKSFLGQQLHPTEAQKTLLSALESKDENTIEQMVIDSSNFICGTTIGILQSKIIKRARASGAECPFDYMILDEASKTTFPEFLVPALYARRWIISGDTKQLSPYVDQEFIQNVVDNLPSFSRNDAEEVKIAKKVSIDVFNSMVTNTSRELRGALIISDENDPNSTAEKYLSQIKLVNSLAEKYNIDPVSFYDIRNKEDSLDSYKLLGSRLVIGTREVIEKNWKIIPPCLAYRGEVYTNIERRDRAIRDKLGIAQDFENWSYEISWRLNRAYEMRGDQKSQKYIKDLDLLVPYTFDEEDNREDIEPKRQFSWRILKDLEKIRKSFYPSIMEMLQFGVSDVRKKDKPYSVPIYDGLPSRVFDQRHVLLKYQHRMHPDISKYARDYFYEGKALRDAYELDQTRKWDYESYYRRRTIWIDIKTGGNFATVNGRNENQAEVNRIKAELNLFKLWAKTNRKSSNEPWKVALLTFYRGQEKALSKMMQDLSNLKNKRRYFDLTSENVDVEVCTVDRFQGQEADVVFLSMVRSRGVGFLDNMNRMNVALTRAKYQNVIVGDKTPFKKAKVEFLRRMAEEMEGPI